MELAEWPARGLSFGECEGERHDSALSIMPGAAMPIIKSSPQLGDPVWLRITSWMSFS